MKSKVSKKGDEILGVDNFLEKQPQCYSFTFYYNTTVSLKIPAGKVLL